MSDGIAEKAHEMAVEAKQDVAKVEQAFAALPGKIDSIKERAGLGYTRIIIARKISRASKT